MDYKEQLENDLLSRADGGYDLYSYRYRDPSVPEQPLNPPGGGRDE